MTGIIEQMSYLRDIRVQGIIVSSFYESEPAIGAAPDYGYEVTNHTAIDPVYGDIADFEELLSVAHDNGLSPVSAEGLSYYRASTSTRC